MLHGKHLFSTVIAASLLFSAACVRAQSAPPAAPPPMHRELPKPTNLQVLPKDIAPADLIAIMRQFTGDLGVHCGFCHEENAQTHRPDFASDAKPEKAAARVMIRMTNDINGKYLTELPDHGAMQKVSCGTCHRGQSTPAAFVPAPERHGPPAGK